MYSGSPDIQVERRWKNVLKIIFILLFCLLLIFLFGSVVSLSRQVSTLAVQVSDLQKINNDLQIAYDDISKEYSNLSESVKNMDTLLHIAKNTADNAGSNILNISDCITVLYHRTGICKSTRSPCLECMNRVLG